MSRKGGQGSHWEECWRQHIDCAEILIEKQQEEIESLRFEILELENTIAYERAINPDRVE